MSRTLDRLAFLLLGAAIMVIAQGVAQPWKTIALEAAVGQSSYCCLSDGVWWQSPMGFNGSLQPAAFELGARTRFGPIGLHLAYANLGTVGADNSAAMRDDEFGRHDAARPCDIATQRNCLGRFAARQNVQGILAGVAYGRALYGVMLEAEAGAFFYRSRWEITIQCPACGEADYSFGYSHSFRYLSDVRRTSYVAARVVYKDAFLMWRRFAQVDGGGTSDEQYATGLTGGPVNQVLVGMRWQF